MRSDLFFFWGGGVIEGVIYHVLRVSYVMLVVPGNANFLGRLLKCEYTQLLFHDSTTTIPNFHELICPFRYITTIFYDSTRHDTVWNDTARYSYP